MSAGADAATDPPAVDRATSPAGTASRLVRVDIAGTVGFAAALAVAVPLRTHRSGQVLIAVVAMVLFAVGVAACLWAYTSALERSRTEEVGVANLFLVTGPTAPRAVRWRLTLCLVAQTVLALAGAAIGVAGLRTDQLNALAFGVLVPMFGIGMNGLWAARYGAFGTRQAEPDRRARASRAEPDNRRME